MVNNVWFETLRYTSVDLENDETRWHQVTTTDVFSGFLKASTRYPSIYFDEMHFKEIERYIVSCFDGS
jgi:hypothetical protein